MFDFFDLTVATVGLQERMKSESTKVAGSSPLGTSNTKLLGAPVDRYLRSLEEVPQ